MRKLSVVFEFGHEGVAAGLEAELCFRGDVLDRELLELGAEVVEVPDEADDLGDLGDVGVHADEVRVAARDEALGAVRGLLEQVRLRLQAADERVDLPVEALEQLLLAVVHRVLHRVRRRVRLARHAVARRAELAVHAPQLRERRDGQHRLQPRQVLAQRLHRLALRLLAQRHRVPAVLAPGRRTQRAAQRLARPAVQPLLRPVPHAQHRPCALRRARRRPGHRPRDRWKLHRWSRWGFRSLRCFCGIHSCCRRRLGSLRTFCRTHTFL